MILIPYFIKKEIRRINRQQTGRVRSFRSLNEIQKVLLFFNASKLEEVQPCIRQLEESHIKVTACAYTDKDIIHWPAPILLVREKQDTNLLGFPSAKIEEQISRIPADLLIDLTDSKSYGMHLLMLKHPSSFKVGGKTEESEQLHDLSITMTNKNDISYLFGQILFYLQTIHSK